MAQVRREYGAGRIEGQSVGASDVKLFMINVTMYKSPEITINEIVLEGVLCVSSELDFIPEEGNM